MPPRTPVVAVMDGGLPGQRVEQAPLEHAAEHLAARGVRAPAVVVVGEVAGLAPSAT
ncbi:hypothetical protein GCM10025868_43050 [Angustibacter aerolatus]|uniref:Tetrapyrrole methylase domain-containing protein n=1 Tax=Angustibacter aerolatus TaxID=1162965 RepID=A0ABQ6JLA5_9ACTN|nr:hypothetical protein GCM10025868_43050 [Angustibacter aerolatus]